MTAVIFVLTFFTLVLWACLWEVTRRMRSHPKQSCVLPLAVFYCRRVLVFVALTDVLAVLTWWRRWPQSTFLFMVLWLLTILAWYFERLARR